MGVRQVIGGLRFEREVTGVLVYHISNPDILRELEGEKSCLGLFDENSFDQRGIRRILLTYKQRLGFPWLSILGSWQDERDIEGIKSRAAVADATANMQIPT